MTVLDDAHSALRTAPDDDALRLRFYERLSDAELFLLLEAEPVDDQAKPMLFPVDGDQYALVFDLEERLVEFTQTTAPYVRLSGRMIVQMIAPSGLGLGLNLGVTACENLLDPATVQWLAQTLSSGVEAAQMQPVAIRAPKGIPDVLIHSLSTKLTGMAGLGKAAYLAEFQDRAGGASHVLAFVDALPWAEPAITTAISETMKFSGIEAGVLDVLFVKSTDPMYAQLTKHGIGFDLPDIMEPKRRAPQAPGMDPDKPPKLR